MKWLVGVLVLALGASACSGSRGGTTTKSGGATTTTAAATGASSKFGDLASPCGPGQAHGATDQGVTDSGITIGYGDDAGFSGSPGLNHELSDAMKAFVKWCNDQGGIEGRKIDARYYDAKIFDVNNVMLDACKTAFMLVGEGFANDAAQEQTRLGCKLPAVPGYSVSPEFANSPLMYEPFPNPVDLINDEGAAALAKRFPQQVQKTAVMFGNFSATQDQKDKTVATYTGFGFHFLDCPQQYNILGEADWRPFAEKLKSCGAQVVYWVGSPYPQFENFLDAAAQVGYRPIYITEPNFYDLAFAAWNKNGNGNDVYVKEGYVPFEEAASNSATKQYLDIVKANKGDVSQLGEQAASAFLLWATAAKTCGSTLTRQCVLGQLAKVDHWTGGGLHADADPARNRPSECAFVLRLQGTRFVRWFPEKAGAYDCSPDYVRTVTGPPVARAQLGPDRVSTKYQTK